MAVSLDLAADLVLLTLIIPKWGISLNGLWQEFLIGGRVFLVGVEVWLSNRYPRYELNNVFTSDNYQ